MASRLRRTGRFPAPIRTAAAAMLWPAAALAQAPAPSPAPEPRAAVTPAATIGQRIDELGEHLRLYGFAALRAFDTEARGSAPDGAIGIQAATLFVDADVPDIGNAFLELRLDYFQEAGQNQSGIGEAYFTIADAFGLGAERAIDLRFGRFDLPFGEYYLLEDPNRNRMIGFPAVMPYRWDEGVMAIVSRDDWGLVAALTEGSFSRNSESGIGPAVTVRGHLRPKEGLYVSASGLYIHEVEESALCFGGSTIQPVSNSATGSSPSTELSSLLGSLDLRWQASEGFHLQASFGGGRIDDPVAAFDRSLLWWMLEPTVTIGQGLDLSLRWSGGGTFSDTRGFALESRPYGDGLTSYGYDLSSIQRFALCLRDRLHPKLDVKAEIGWDDYSATAVSGLPDDTRMFVAGEIVLSF